MNKRIAGTMDMYKIGNNLRGLSEKRKETQMQAAERLGISFNHYAKMEEGMRGMSLNMLFKLMNYYGTDANTILGTKTEEEIDG